MSYLNKVSIGKKTAKRKSCPQSEPIPGSKQVLNNAGGYVFDIGPFKQLERFLVLGSEGGSFYVKEEDLTGKNINSLIDCLKADGDEKSTTTQLVTDFWNSNRAPRPNPIMFALATIASFGGKANKKALEEKFNATVRTGYHLFRFVHYVNEMRGWGRYLKRLVSNWYFNRTVNDLSFQLAKYQSREGWSHKDVLKLAHPYGEAYSDLFSFVVGKTNEIDIQPFSAMQELNKSLDEKQCIKYIQKYNLTHEMIPGQLKASDKVWEALFEKMPLTALIRNLGNLTARNVIGPGRFDNNRKVVERLLDKGQLSQARIHPVQLLSAHKVYKTGHGEKGSLSWDPAQEIVAALEHAFYLSFDFVESSDKRFLLGLDVSSSMGLSCGTLPMLSCAEVAAVMLMVTLKREQSCLPMAFSHRFKKLNVNSASSLKEVMKTTRDNNFGGTDCALPMVYALDNKIEIDTFVVYTDCETWFGNVHPVQALKQYRKKINPAAKLVVVGMIASEFSIADPKDPGMLDVVGFDSVTPSVITNFSK